MTRHEPQRPSTFREDPYERTEDSPTVDYPIDEPDEEIEYGFETSEVDPIPVYQVEAPPQAQEIVQWSSERFTVGTTPVMVAGDNRNRKSVSIINHSTNDVFLAPIYSTQVAFLGKIDPGASIELTCNSRVYALCDTDTSAEVSVYQEYVLIEPEND